MNTAPTAATVGSVVYLTPIQQGDNISEREGNSIKVQSFEIKGFYYRDPAAAAAAAETVRVLVVRDLQNQGAAPTGGDIFENLTGGFSPLQPIDFLNSNDLNKRFTVVYDTMFTTDLYHPIETIDFSTTHDCHVFFRGTSSVVTSAGNGAYFLVVVSSSTSNPGSLQFTSRLRFTDN